MVVNCFALIYNHNLNHAGYYAGSHEPVENDRMPLWRGQSAVFVIATHQLIGLAERLEDMHWWKRFQPQKGH